MSVSAKRRQRVRIFQRLLPVRRLAPNNVWLYVALSDALSLHDKQSFSQ